VPPVSNDRHQSIIDWCSSGTIRSFAVGRLGVVARFYGRKNEEQDFEPEFLGLFADSRVGSVRAIPPTSVRMP